MPGSQRGVAPDTDHEDCQAAPSSQCSQKNVNLNCLVKASPYFMAVATLLLESTCLMDKAQTTPRVRLSVHTVCLMTGQTAYFDSLWEQNLSTSFFQAYFCWLK